MDKKKGRAFLAPAALAALLAGGGGAARAADVDLPVALEEVSEMDRVGLIATWAVSSAPRARLAIARALRHAAPAVGSISAIEHLARDRDPLVRVAIAEAAWLRRHEDPARLIAVLHRLADDPEPFVREVAHLALGDV
jgi:hypothetical protein